MSFDLENPEHINKPDNELRTALLDDNTVNYGEPVKFDILLSLMKLQLQLTKIERLIFYVILLFGLVTWYLYLVSYYINSYKDVQFIKCVENLKEKDINNISLQCVLLLNMIGCNNQQGPSPFDVPNDGYTTDLIDYIN